MGKFGNNFSIIESKTSRTLLKKPEVDCNVFKEQLYGYKIAFILLYYTILFKIILLRILQRYLFLLLLFIVIFMLS